MQAAESVLNFWFSPAAKSHWFQADMDFDAEIARRFGDLLHAARNDRLSHWEDTARGALALVIVLDQFTRNIYRGNAKAFILDPLARNVASRAIERRFDDALSPQQKMFLYMPFMHSEALSDQDRCVALCRNAGLGNLEYAEHHRDIIKRFGRFPHRNELLARPNTAEEARYLASGDAFTGGQKPPDDD